jgi:hypothetical protein
MPNMQILVVCIAAVAAATMVIGLIWWNYRGRELRFTFAGLTCLLPVFDCHARCK